MSLTTDRNNPCLNVIKDNGMQACYLVLSDEELAKGFVAPVRTKYKHLKCGGITYMADKIADTYARNPSYYSGTYCSTCGTHFDLTMKMVNEEHPSGKLQEWYQPQFAWIGKNGKEDGTFVGEWPKQVNNNPAEITKPITPTEGPIVDFTLNDVHYNSPVLMKVRDIIMLDYFIRPEDFYLVEYYQGMQKAYRDLEEKILVRQDAQFFTVYTGPTTVA